MYLLKDDVELSTNLPKVVVPSLDEFTKEQSESAISLVQQVSKIDVEQNDIKKS